MNTIWKFPLQIVDEQTIDLPENAHILDVQVQDGVICLWAVVNWKAFSIPKIISMRGTEHQNIPSPNYYIGTVQLDGFVWHVFA